MNAEVLEPMSQPAIAPESVGRSTIAALRARLAAVHREEARLHLALAAAIEDERQVLPATTSAPRKATLTRGVYRLPSGNYRMRLEWGGRAFSSTHKTEAEAHAAREQLVADIASGRRARRGSTREVCGIKPFRAWPSTGGVYFAAIPGLLRVKIGWATHLARRLGELRRLVPDLVLLAHGPGGRAEESDLHRRFAPLREAGEWFRLEADLLAHIESLRSR